MARKLSLAKNIKIDKIVGGGQALGQLDDGRKLFVWGALPGEEVDVQLTKHKSRFAEGVATTIIRASKDRVTPKDPASHLSTSPWQIMSPEAELHYKSALIEEAFELHDIVLPNPIETETNNINYGYRNKLEFSWYGHEVDGEEKLELAFFRRGSRGKIIVNGSSLAPESMNQLARQLRDVLNRKKIVARDLKSLVVRTDQAGQLVFQLYVKNVSLGLDLDDFKDLKVAGGEVIYSNPLSPASLVTKKLLSFGSGGVLNDSVLEVPFSYAAEGFFQINIPVYEQALLEMDQFINPAKRVVDLYSGVGSIGLTIGGQDVTLVESSEYAVHEMKNNIKKLRAKAQAVLAPSEQALDYITGDKTIIVDPPRAGLHQSVIDRLIEVGPERIIYLSCNPVTQARDVEKLAAGYGVKHHKGFNFFPRTPHIEHLVVLDQLQA